MLNHEPVRLTSFTEEKSSSSSLLKKAEVQFGSVHLKNITRSVQRC